VGLALDEEEFFEIIKGDCFARINDEKFSTGRSCVRNCKKINNANPKTREKVKEFIYKYNLKTTLPGN